MIPRELAAFNVVLHLAIKLSLFSTCCLFIVVVYIVSVVITQWIYCFWMPEILSKLMKIPERTQNFLIHASIRAFWVEVSI